VAEGLRARHDIEQALNIIKENTLMNPSSHRMLGIRALTRAGGAAALAVISLTLGGVEAGAHTQIVTPPSQDEPVVSGPISKPFAQAHCNAAAPEVLGTDSVVGFAPYAALPCPAVANPGGQVHP
jgi:hypothetical protein